jgi:hypothetical protein
MSDDDMYIPGSQKGLFANLTAWIVAGLVLAGIITGGIWAFVYYTADTRGKVQAQQQIKSGANRIQPYDHFFNLCAAVQTDEARLEAQYQVLAAGPSQDERERILTNIAGIASDRADAINQYNADARKDYTIGQFRSSALPYQLPTGTYTKGVNTTCIA